MWWSFRVNLIHMSVEWRNEGNLIVFNVISTEAPVALIVAAYCYGNQVSRRRGLCEQCGDLLMNKGLGRLCDILWEQLE
jgi:hypothetical protein